MRRMRRVRQRAAVLAVVGGLLLAGSATGVTAAGGSCVVQHVDQRGTVIATAQHGEGTEYGRFRCAGRMWQLTVGRSGEKTVVAREIQVNPAGVVSARRIAGAALGYDLTFAEMADVVEAVTGERDVAVGRAVVVADDGRQRTRAEVEALLAGRDGTGARVLRTLDRPAAGLTAGDLIGSVGGTPDNTVVYFSIWGAIERAINWVVEKLEEAGQWLENHCDWGSDPDGIFVVCRW